MEDKTDIQAATSPPKPQGSSLHPIATSNTSHNAQSGLSSPIFHRNVIPAMELSPKHRSEINSTTGTTGTNLLTPLTGPTTVQPTVADGKKILDPLDQLLMTLQAKADAETKEREEQALKGRDLLTPAKSENIPTITSPFNIANPFATPVFTPEIVKESERAFSALGLSTKLTIDEEEQSVAKDDEQHSSKTTTNENKESQVNSDLAVANPMVPTTPTSPPIAMSRATAAALGIAYVENEETTTTTMAFPAVVKSTSIVVESADNQVVGPSQSKEVPVGLAPSSSGSSYETTANEEDDSLEIAKRMESKADDKVMATVWIDEKTENTTVPQNEGGEPWVPPEFPGLNNSQRLIPEEDSTNVSVLRIESKQETVVTKEETKNVIAGKVKPPLPIKGKKEDDADATGEAMILAEMERILHERQSEKSIVTDEGKDSEKTNLTIAATAVDTMSSAPSSSTAAAAETAIAEAGAAPDISMLMMSGLSSSHDQGNKSGSPTKAKTVLSDKAAYVRHISTKYDDMMALHVYRQNKLLHDEEKQRQKDQEQSKQEGQNRRTNSRSRGSRHGSSQSPLKKARALHLGGGAVGYDANVLALAGYSRHVGMWRGYPYDAWSCCGTSGTVCPTPNTARLVEVPTNTYGEPLSTVTITQFGIASPPRRKRRASMSDTMQSQSSSSSSSKATIPDKLFLTAKTAAKDIIVKRQLRSLSARVRPKDYDEFLSTQDLSTKKNNSFQSIKNNQSGELGEKKEWELQWGLRKHSGRDREQEKEELFQQTSELKSTLAAQKAMRIAYENTTSNGERRWRSPFKTTTSFDVRGAAAASTYPSTKDRRIWMPAFERSYNVRAVAAERAATQTIQSLASTAWKDIMRQRQHHTPSYGQFMTDVLVDTSAAASSSSSSTTDIHGHGHGVHPSSPMSTSLWTTRNDVSPASKNRSPLSSSNAIGQRLYHTTSKLPLKTKLMDFPEPITNDILNTSVRSTDVFTINSSTTVPSWKPPGATSITKKRTIPRNKPVMNMKVTVRKT